MKQIRKPSRLSESLQRHLNAYALAASAAGVGMLALSQPTEGKIVYTPAHKHIGANKKIGLDLNHDSRVDFVFTDTQHISSAFWTDVLWVSGGSKNGVVGWYATRTYASALNSGVRIGPKLGTENQADMGVCGGNDNTTTVGCVGPWIDVKHRYLGLKFQIHGKTHFGWARLNVSFEPHPRKKITGLLTGYAYETIPNKPIIAGKTKGPDVITVDPGSLGQLAQGSAGRLGKQ